MRLNNKLAVLAIVPASLVSASALAAVPAAVTTAISDAAADIAILGAAVLVVIVAYKVFQWLRRAM